MRILLISISLLFCTALSFAQLGNNGALISVKSGAMMSVHEEVVNYNGGEFHNTDTIYLFDDWTNNAGNEAFISLGVGIVNLYGGDQRIKGTDITRFYDLRLLQTGVKYGDLDVYVDGFLRLNDRRFHLDTNCVSVFNPQIISVENVGEGYVSALWGGGLLRNVADTQPYFYPVGWPGYYRPAELTMDSPAMSQFKLRMAFTDATLEGFDRGLREPTLCNVNSLYYHYITRESGGNAARVKLHYDPAIDGDWNTIARWQDVPQWQDPGDETSGVDAITGLNYYESVDYFSDFTYPAFALGDGSDTLALVASDTVICLGDEVVFSTDPSYINYDFFVNGELVQSSPSSAYITSDLEDGDTITFVATANECIYYGSTIIMIVNPLPIATASSDSPVCENASLQLSASGATGYAWEGPDGFSSLEQNPTIDNIGLSAIGDYIVTITDGNGCTDTDTTSVSVYPAPIPVISSNSPICDGDTVFLYSNEWVDYEWEGVNNFLSNFQNPVIPNATLAAAGTYTITVTDDNACTNTASLEIIVHPLPPATASNNSPVCLNESISLTAGGGISYVWEGPNGFISNQQNPVIPISALADAGIYTVTVTDGNGCVNPASTQVIVHDLPVATASSDSPVCDGTSLSLSANGGVSYTWEGPNDFVSSEQNPIISPISLAANGIYTVTVTDMNGCTNTTTTEVIVHPLPVITTNSNSPICDGDDLNLFADGAVDYIWSGPNGFSSNEQNPVIPAAGLAAAGAYMVTATDGNGCVNISTTEVIVHPLPDATASNNSPVCLNESISLMAGAGISYVWEGPGGFNSNQQNPTIPISILENAGVYTVTVTDVNGCVNTASTTVIVHDLPTPMASSDSPVCDGTSLSLSANGGVSYTWEGPNDFVSNEQNPTINPISLLGNGTYFVTVTDGNGCTNVATTEAIVHPLPVITTDSNSPICEGDDLNLSANGAVDYIWSGPNGFSSNEQNPAIPVAGLAAAGLYIVTGTDGNGCVNTDTTTVIVNPLPNAMAWNSGVACPGFDISLFASGGISYEWSAPNGFFSLEQNPILQNVNSSTAGIYTVIVTDANGCMNTASTQVDVHPPVDETAANNSPICLGGTVQLSATGDGNWLYQWSGVGGFSSTQQNPTWDDAQLEESGTYTVTITDANGCTNEYNTVVFVSDYPSVETTVTSPVCEGEPVFLETTYNQNWEYYWEGPVGFMDSVDNPIINEVFVENGGTYTVTVVNAAGCATVDTTHLTVYPGVMATAYGDTTIFENATAMIGVQGGLGYSWSPTESLNCPDCSEALATPLETTEYTVVVINEFGCLDTFRILVEVLPQTGENLVVPNTITPNDDGKNDLWVIPWIHEYKDNEVVILNRWGDEVYSSRPYQNEFGGNYEGLPLPAGTYYFILKLGQDFPVYKGPLTILRE